MVLITELLSQFHINVNIIMGEGQKEGRTAFLQIAKTTTLRPKERNILSYIKLILFLIIIAFYHLERVIFIPKFILFNVLEFLQNINKKM